LVIFELSELSRASGWSELVFGNVEDAKKMKYRSFGRTGWQVSSVGFGAWAIGGSWGAVDEAGAMAALNASIDEGINFIDTADVYGDGRSERLVSRLLRERSERIYVATKAGQSLAPHVAGGYNQSNLTKFVESSLKNLRVDALDLLQLHCPPNEVYYMPEVFQVLEDLVGAGKLRYYGVSVEKVEEGLKAIEYPNLQSVQIIFNVFRQRPAELFFERALEKKVGILARVPLASGLLTGKMDRSTTFPDDDHRNFNRDGAAFDVGETFSGVDFETGLKAVDRLRTLIPADLSMTQFALRWILMFEAVSCVIPGAKNRSQALENAMAADLPDLGGETMKAVEGIYNDLIRNQVHQRW
jgi:aryl-alcohol dehydrogenase-like predicted oxidoreductase